MIDRKTHFSRDNYIKELIRDNLYLAQMEVVEINDADLSATLKYGDDKYFKNCSLRGLNLEIDAEKDIYNVEIPELNSKVWCLVWGHQAILIKTYRPEKLLTTINDTKVSITDKDVSVICEKIHLNCDKDDEPIVLGDSLKSLLNKMLDLMTDTYNHMLQHTHQSTGAGSITTPVTTTPSETARITEIKAKLSNIKTEVSNLSNILSTKNFGG